MKISVIVPIYKVENYIKECVDSILAQSYTDLELILVDDGSPDNCPKICDEYLKIDQRIKVIHKANGGLANARNAGLRVATGEYVAFIDSDDYIDKETFFVMLKEIKENDADICCCGMTQFNNDSKWNTISLPKETLVYEGDSVYKLILLKDGCGDYMCNKIFKRSIFDKVSLVENVIFEDIYVMHKIFAQAKKVVFVNENFYYYRYNNQGISHNSNINPRYMDFYYSAKGQYEFSKTISKEIEDCGFAKFMSANLWVANAIYRYNIFDNNQNFELIKRTIKDNKKAIKNNKHLSKRTKWLLIKISKGKNAFIKAKKRIKIFDDFSRRPKIQKILFFVAPQVNSDNGKY